MKKLLLAAVILLAVVTNCEAFGHRKASRSGCAGVSGCSGTVQVTVTAMKVGCHGVLPTQPVPLAPKPLPPPQATAPVQAPPMVFVQAVPVRLFGRLRGAGCR